MNVSISLQLVMQYAAREAIAAQFGEILPEHMFIALLKCSELPREQIWSVASDPAVRDVLLNDVEELRGVLDARSIDAKAARRTVRQKLGTGAAPYHGGDMHRSRECRDLFERSARRADDRGDDVMVPAHMLDVLCTDPPRVIRELLESIGPARHEQSRASWLGSQGSDITADRVASELPATAGRSGEIAALVRALADDSRRCILTVSEKEQLPRALLLAIARGAAAAEIPRSLRALRIVAIASPPRAFSSAALTTGAVSELERSRKLLLLIPLRERIPDAPEWHGNLLRLIMQGTVRCVCDVSPSAFDAMVRDDARWKKVAHVMHFTAEAAGLLPEQV